MILNQILSMKLQTVNDLQPFQTRHVFNHSFIVGVRNLSIFKDKEEIKPNNHACILVDNDLFEYGEIPENEENKIKVNKTFIRHRGVGKAPEFDWDYLGKDLNGKTFISPVMLELEINIDGQWDEGHYDILDHNCHDFVLFCLYKLGCSTDIITKFKIYWDMV